MAKLTETGSVIARCPSCDGGTSTFEWAHHAPDARNSSLQRDFGRVVQRHMNVGGQWHDVIHLLLRCAGCGGGGLAVIKLSALKQSSDFPQSVDRMLSFHPEVRERLRLPETVPNGIASEFREAEKCMEADCLRAAAGLFRSVLDKTMRANGYKTLETKDLFKQIEAAAADGVITESRKKRAHEDIRVLGNDVLHDEWHPIGLESVEVARHYAQRILEDFYDDRPTILGMLRAKGRVAHEDEVT